VVTNLWGTSLRFLDRIQTSVSSADHTIELSPWRGDYHGAMKLLSVACVVLLGLAGCSLSSSEKPHEVEIYFAGDSPKGLVLFSEIHLLVASDAQLPGLVIDKLVSGEIVPDDPDYVNLWSGSRSLRGIDIAGSHATIDLTEGAMNLGSAAETLAIDQVVWTLTGLVPSVSTLSFLVKGEPAESLAGHVDVTVDFYRAPDFEALSAIQITSLKEGQELLNPVSISGMACTFEATVVWELLQDEVSVAQGFTSASEACPVRSPFEVVLGELEPGVYRFRAMEYSAEDGSLTALDDKVFILR
jgi:hypothetical protein